MKEKFTPLTRAEVRAINRRAEIDKGGAAVNYHFRSVGHGRKQKTVLVRAVIMTQADTNALGRAIKDFHRKGVVPA